MQQFRAHHSPRRGFTLVEMLVVITIIGVLVALLIPTVAAVTRRTRNAAIALEIQDLARAMDAYKAFANDYPPDFTSTAALTNHVAKAFPRNTRNVANWLNSQDNSDKLTPPKPKRKYSDLDAAEALVVWLSQLSTNPRDPLSGIDGAYTGERKVFFAFDETRVIDKNGDGWPEYYPKHGNERPYVYFDGRVVGGEYAYRTAAYIPPSAASNEVVRPFRSVTPIDARDNNRTKPANQPTGENTTQWIKPGTFQILCAGQDNEFGPDMTVGNPPVVIYKKFPTPNYPLPSADEDNITDFSEMKTLADSVP